MATLASAIFREPALNSQFQIHRSHLGLTFPDGALALGALEEPDAIVGNEVEDEVKNKLFAKFAESLYSIRKFEGKVA